MKGLIQQKGLTLVELMVGLVLGLILTGGLIQVYFGAKSTATFTNGLARLQENSSYALDTLSRDIRMAGYVPCGSPQTFANVVNNHDTQWWANIFAQPLRGYDGGSAGLPDHITSLNERVASADVLVVLRAGTNVANVESYVGNQFTMQNQLGAGWVEDDSLMLACDPRHAALFQIEEYVDANNSRIDVAASGSPGNCTTQLGVPAPANCSATGQSGQTYGFGNDAQLADYSASIYYIRSSASGRDFSLYRNYLLVNGEGELRTRPEELVEGVENMQILYGLDQDDDGVADQYMQAVAIDDGDWLNVVSARIGLLVASQDGVRDTSDTQTYRVADVDVGPESGNAAVTHAEDRRKRYVSNMTVGVRNAGR